jgi:hypothetical protein
LRVFSLVTLVHYVSKTIFVLSTNYLYSLLNFTYNIFLFMLLLELLECFQSVHTLTCGCGASEVVAFDVSFLCEMCFLHSRNANKVDIVLCGWGEDLGII